jgi:predicted glycogen debranching enzyme
MAATLYDVSSSSDSLKRAIYPISERHEWLEADGLGGFASGTTSGIRTRRYHALLLAATTPPSGRVVLVNGMDAWIKIGTESYAISSQRYGPTIVYPDGYSHVKEFRFDPWPTRLLEFRPGNFIRHELFVPHGRSAVVLSWRFDGDPIPGATLVVRPLLSGRDFHSLHRQNSAFKFDATLAGEEVVWQPYAQLPSIFARSNGSYRQAPDWYRNFFYFEERNRGLNDVEDLASPGIFEWDLTKGSAILTFATESEAIGKRGTSCADLVTALQIEERAARETNAIDKNGRQTNQRLEQSVDSYFVKRGSGKTVIAGYPWFGDWGRDTFIALRGLALATGRFEAARDILLEWSQAVSEGMLPNRFPDRGETPEFNSVDASLWYIIAVDDFIHAAGPNIATNDVIGKLTLAIEAILAGYCAGTRFGIRAEPDGLLAAGVKGTQLTWMDAKVNGYVVTPRIGKPVEVQALWLNALSIASRFSKRWSQILEQGKLSFEARFWNEELGFLSDVVDVNHQPGKIDYTFRPNQIFAVGGLPLVVLSEPKARRVVDAVESRLWTRMGLRSLASNEPGYSPHYEGDPGHRDTSYHQGTVWPWLTGAFVEAWVRVRGDTDEAKTQARAKFLAPLLDHLDDAGLRHVSEIADAEPPFMPRGCPFQAWSLGELLRLDRRVLGGTV